MENMEYKVHIPTEQYGYVEVTTDSPEQAKLASNEIKAQFGITVPLTDYDTLKDKKFNEIIDNYLLGKITADEYAELNPLQKQVVQVIKRSLNRIKNKEK